MNPFSHLTVKQDKLECSEELGDLISQVDANMALSVYLRANAAEKVVNSFSQRGEFDKMVAYASKVGYRCDYTVMLQNMVRTNPQGALAFAKKAATTEPPQIDPNVVVETFMSASLVQETTAFLLEALKNNKKEEGYLQTKLLEINLLGGSPQASRSDVGSRLGGGGGRGESMRGGGGAVGTGG